ncbi:hypothetical protein, partial [Moorena sp. SIO3H5]|uniref:hypothetical protein n=1 Tax=Moorena sp. SIO3H5 TaxID=2607834 RepID=UPI0025E12ED4
LRLPPKKFPLKPILMGRVVSCSQRIICSDSIDEHQCVNSHSGLIRKESASHIMAPSRVPDGQTH